MSDNLRDALEELAAERDSVSGHVGSDYRIRPYELRELLASHPVEPAPVASRERVAEVLETVWLAEAEAKTVDSPRGHCDRLAAALLAAGVFREMPTREEMVEAISARLHITTDTICDGGKPRHLSADTSAVHEAADAVLALIGGG